MNKERMYNILTSQHYSEKSTMTAQRANTLAFKTARDATKLEIKTAIEEIFQVSVVGVRTLNVKGKRKRTKHGISQYKNWKKAYVRLAEGQSIDIGGQG